MGLQCPPGSFSYFVQPGDSLYSLANRYGISVDAIRQANPEADLRNLHKDQVLCIPGMTQPVTYGYGYMYIPDGYNYFPGIQGVTAAVDPPLQHGPPNSPPPDFIPKPSKSPGAAPLRVDPGALTPCIFRFSYLWLKNSESFWAYLVYVGRTSAAGWRYRRKRWVYFGVDLDDIKSFNCY